MELCKMFKLSVFVFVFFGAKSVLSQGTGSGNNGNLRVCVVEGRGSYRRAGKFCPTLDEEQAGVECVIGVDRLDCLRRMGKGTVDFGVFSPEDLIAAQWANLEVLVTNEVKNRPRNFEKNIVAVVNRRLLPNSSRSNSVHAILRNSTLCHPGGRAEDSRGMSDTLLEYLESLVTQRSCDPQLSLNENRIKAMSDFFAKGCKAGPWVANETRDTELKLRYPNLCAACAALCNDEDPYWGISELRYPNLCAACAALCNDQDPYWGISGALSCLSEGAGDFTWAHLDDVQAYFGIFPVIASGQKLSPADYAYLCRDGTWQSLETQDPCVWLNRPWPVVVAKRKAAEAVSSLAYALTNSSVVVDAHWRGALAALLELNQQLTEPLQPPRAPLDHLSGARGFREAFSQSGCQPPRHVTLCTTSLLEQHKCGWLSEAGAVYGVAPPLQCSLADSIEACFAEVAQGGADVLLADSDWLVRGLRDYSTMPVLHETTPIFEQKRTTVAFVLEDSKITNMSELRGKNAAFPRFDGFAWHSVSRYLSKKQNGGCNNAIAEYFGDVCAPGVEKFANLSSNIKERLLRNCYRDGDGILDGELQALRSLLEGKSEVAFLSYSTFRQYSKNLIQEPWAEEAKTIVPVCPDEDKKYCLISWSNLGHLFAAKNLSQLRKQEISNVFTKLDHLFGKSFPFHIPMFAMYGPFNHQNDVIFHNATKYLSFHSMYGTNPFHRMPDSFESKFVESNFSSCLLKVSNGVSDIVKPTMFLLISFIPFLLGKLS